MFRTELPLAPISQQLPLSARVLTVGSCFSDTIGNRLADTKVHTLTNPFGTVFNPITACKLLRAAAGEDMDWQQHLVEARGRWQSYDLHASLGADSPVELLETIQQLLRDTGVFLATADVVVLTLGTAWAYRLKETDELVSNCHKVPAEKFTKELLTPDEIINAVAETHAYLRQRNPKLRFVLTVSPVRHLKDTLPLNAVSKSVLRVACHYLSELLPDVSYFPAYELLLDDLRDYRFYAADMLHPSPVAEDYIWERFTRTYFDADFGRFRKEFEAVRQALHHRPLYAAAPEHRQFLVGTLDRLEKLAGQADVRMEILEVRRQLQNLPVPKPRPVPEPKPEDDEERIDVGNAAEPEVAVPERRAPVAATPAAAEVAPVETETRDEAEDLAESLTEAGLPKKKRRNRGGAKRNKKKHAARLAEEAAALLPPQEASAPEASLVPELDSVAAEQQSPPAVVTLPLDPNAVLQTALERRKRGSRRGRGGKKLPEAPTDAAVTADIEGEPASTTPDPTAEAAAPASEGVEALQPETPPTSLPDQDAAAGLQRPARTGRSASEVRAAALRKPRRPDSRIKTLYATSPEPQATEPTEPTEPTVDTENPQPATSAAAEVPVSSAPPTPPEAAAETQAPTLPPAPPVRPPVVSAIPPVKGTGASGRLTAAGQATLNTGPAKSKPVPVGVEPLTRVESPTPPAAPSDAVARPDSSEEPATEAAATPAEAEAPAEAPAPVKPRRQPASPKARQQPVASEQPAAPQQAAAPSPKAKPNKRVPKPNTVAAAPETPAATEAASVPTPAARRRKPAAKPKAVAPESPPTPKRPARRKPTPPDEAPDAS